MRLNRFKTIFFRVILYLSAFQVLNVSIDVDYVVQGFRTANVEGFDDIDSFTELLVEQFSGDDNLFEDTGYDHDNPFDTENTRLESDQLGRPTPIVHKQLPPELVSSTWPCGMQSAHITCIGYRAIITPPPDRA
ncbi:hypothetical protein [Paraflavitalea pollutisoli]|uniref:hypothetical protein n=1 Tax=Paraflavitalea pollutisoli TaxID=3034143 RepID=UPI0023EADF85|nr:hypothetical protein [Paraflavitalea sp. H1-2-19X]